MSLAGKRALVTGSTMGIGHAAVRGLLAAGANVALHGRSLDRVKQEVDNLQAGGRAVAVAGDVAEASACQAIVENAIALLGGLDFLVCNA